MVVRVLDVRVGLHLRGLTNMGTKRRRPAPPPVTVGRREGRLQNIVRQCLLEIWRENGLDTLPIVREVKEVWDHQRTGPDINDHEGAFVLVAPDPMSGRAHRYSVIRVDYQTGIATVIGRELDLRTARKIAARG